MQNENELYNVQFWSYTIQKGELKKKIAFILSNTRCEDISGNRLSKFCYRKCSLNKLAISQD